MPLAFELPQLKLKNLGAQSTTRFVGVKRLKLYKDPLLHFVVAGAFLFAVLCARTKALQPDTLAALTQFGVTAAFPSAKHIFWSAVIGGWIIAMVAWLVSASHSITGSVALIWSLTFIVGIGHFAHCIATSGEILVAVLCHKVTAIGYLEWLGLASAGNITGGVVLVTLLEYGQAKLD